MTDAFDGIRSQDHAVRTLRRAVAEDRVASAYLFDGPSGVGKKRAAFALAKTVIGAESARRIDEGKHPDVRIFEPREDGHRNIRVDRLREEILPYAEFAPFEGDAAFLIFPEADVSFPEKHPESANAILKTLEEPKRGVTFVLLAERPDRLLPTIRSRCQRVRFARLPIEEVERIALDGGATASVARAAAALSGGRADRALSLCEDDAAESLFQLAVDVHDAASGRRPGAMLEAADRLAKVDDLGLALEGLALFYRDLVRAELGHPEEALAFRHQAESITKRAQSCGADEASARFQLLVTASESLEANGNKQVVLDSLVFRLRRAR